MWETISTVMEIVVVATRAPAISEFCAKPFITHRKHSTKWGPEPPFTGEETGNREAKRRAQVTQPVRNREWVSDPGCVAQSPLLLFTKAQNENESTERGEK